MTQNIKENTYLESERKVTDYINDYINSEILNKFDCNQIMGLFISSSREKKVLLAKSILFTDNALTRAYTNNPECLTFIYSFLSEDNKVIFLNNCSLSGLNFRSNMNDKTLSNLEKYIEMIQNYEIKKSFLEENDYFGITPIYFGIKESALTLK